MTIKELSQLYWLKREIETDTGRLEELRARAYAAKGSKINAVSGGNRSSCVEAAAVELADLDRELHQKKRERDRLEGWIRSIPDTYLRRLFVLRFERRHRWWQIAWEMGGGNTADSVRMAVKRYIERENKKD